MHQLDIKDRRILYELDLNARQSDTQIAKKVGLSRDSVRYRINKLIDGGYINYFMTILNSMKLGFDWYRTFFKFQNLTLEIEKEIIEWLKEKASWITTVEGKWDLNTGIFCKNVYEFRDVIDDFLLKYSKYVDNYEVAIVTREWVYNKDYLLSDDKKFSEPLIMGFAKKEDYNVEQIDEVDYNILKVILKNARMKTIEIAQKINMTEMIVRYRIKRLVERGIIIGFKPFFNVNKLGFIYFKVHFKLHDFNNEKKKKIISYMHTHINTVHSTELVGGADVEVEFQVKSNDEFYNILKEIRFVFGSVIKSYDFMQYTKEYKFTYLPEMY